MANYIFLADEDRKVRDSMRALGAKVYAKAVENHIASSVVFVAATIQMLILTKKFKRQVLRDCKEGTCITLRNECCKPILPSSKHRPASASYVILCLLCALTWMIWCCLATATKSLHVNCLSFSSSFSLPSSFLLCFHIPLISHRLICLPSPL